MKERFKFRIWDKIDKRFMSGSISIDCRKGCMAGNMPEDKYVIQQCTGLKDKNDKSIYEGDIVIINHTTPFGTEIKKVCTVEFADGCFWARTKADAVILYHENNVYEIIGNIYENKELLGVAQ